MQLVPALFRCRFVLPFRFTVLFYRSVTVLFYRSVLPFIFTVPLPLCFIVPFYRFCLYFRYRFVLPFRITDSFYRFVLPILFTVSFYRFFLPFRFTVSIPVSFRYRFVLSFRCCFIFYRCMIFILIVGCLRFTEFSWVGKHVNIIMKPTNCPTQGQPNPRKNWLKVAIGPLFPTANNFSWVGICFYVGNRLRDTQPNQNSPHSILPFRCCFVAFFIF